MERKICIALDPLEERHRAAIREAAEALGFTPCFLPEFPEAPAPLLADCEVLYTGNAALLSAAPDSLRWLAFAYAGVDSLCRDPAFLRREDCRLTCSNTYGVTLTEHTLMVLLMLLRRLPETLASARQSWQNELPIRSIQDGRFTILGAGHIGGRIAQALKALGAASVTGVSRSGKSRSSAFDAVHPIGELDAVLRATEHLICVLPSTPETRGLFTAEKFALLPQGATFINVGRGDLLDQDALMDALKSGRLAGAAIDVTTPEPLPPEHPLWDCPNLILTPHAAGGLVPLPRSRDDNAALFCENLRRYAAGQPLQGLVDPKTGY